MEGNLFRGQTEVILLEKGQPQRAALFLYPVCESSGGIGAFYNEALGLEKFSGLLCN